MKLDTTERFGGNGKVLGKCHCCGRPTKLPVHQKCGKKGGRKTPARKFDEAFVDRLVKL